MKTTTRRVSRPYAAFGCSVLDGGKRIVATAGSPQDAHAIAEELNARADLIQACAFLPDHQGEKHTPFDGSGPLACLIKGVFLVGALPRAQEA